VNLKFNNGAVMGLTDVTIDSLRGLEAFKPTQGWNLFRRPATLVRTETIDLAGDLDRITDEKLTVRKVLYGERGSGKSVLQIQALAIASLNNWLVVHIPEAKDLANAHTSYEPIETPDGIQYIQPHYTAQLLGKIAQTNNTVLSKLTMLEKHRLPITLDPSATLADLAQAGAKDPEISWPIWQALWKELLIKGKRRPRILYSLDGIDHVMRLSAYLNRDLQPIHAHELTLVKQYMDFLAGRIPMPNGGMVLAATSESNRAAAHTLDHCLKRRWALQNGQEPPRWDPYVAHDKWVQEVMESPAVVKLEGLSKKEARGVMEYYARSGVLRSAVTDGLVSETWTLAGGGIIGQVEKASLRTHF
jgi:small subunit ribosomal protein S29